MYEDGKRFKIDLVVRQGDTTSPKLLTTALKLVLKNMLWHGARISIYKQLSHLRFADDIVDLGQSARCNFHDENKPTNAFLVGHLS